MKRSPWLGLAALLLLCSITLFFGLGRVPFLGPDEPRYAEIAREMWVNSDYVSPRLAGRLWFEKAPLLYWGQAFFYSIFGPTELAARLPSAFGALLAVLMLWGAARRAFGERGAFYVGVVAATQVPFIAFSHGGSTDMPLCAMLAGAIVCLWHSRQSEKTSFGWLLGSAAFTAGAMLAKGLIGPLLVTLVGGAWWLWAKPTVKLKPLQLVAALAVFFAVSATWYWPVWATHGSVFYEEFFVNHHFKRYTSNEYNHPQPFYFYLVIGPLATLPWLLWLVGAARQLPKLKPRLDARQSLIALGWAWAIVPIAFFSISGSKLPSYMLPSFPGFAIVIGEALSRGVFLPKSIKPKWAAATGAGLMSLVVLYAFLVYAPAREEKLSTKALCLRVAQKMAPGEKATLFRLPKDYDPVFYLEGRMVVGTGKRDIFYAQEVAEFVPMLKDGSLLVFANNREASLLEESSLFQATFLDRDDKLSVFRLRKRS
ncbi:glycosyltransferase family 39 protein [bacterium]|nr:MAG: glycosyltransferase family 39 protein [bacterium]